MFGDSFKLYSSYKSYVVRCPMIVKSIERNFNDMAITNIDEDHYFKYARNTRDRGSFNDIAHNVVADLNVCRL